MSAASSLRFLSPRLCRDVSASSRAAYVRFYSIAKGVEAPALVARTQSGDVAKRILELRGVRALEYPRIVQDSKAFSCAEFRERYHLLRGGEVREGETVTLRGMSARGRHDRLVLIRVGRIYASRIAGSKLVFIDLVQDGKKVQGLCNLKRLAALGVTPEDFKAFYHLVRRGDIICE